MTARVDHVSFRALLADLCSSIMRIPEPRPDTAVASLVSEFRANLVRIFERPELYYKRTRDAIFRQFGEQTPAGIAANRVLRMTRKENRDSRTEQAAVTHDRNRHQTVLTFNFIEARVGWLKTNWMPVDKIALLMLASGARRCEILRADIATFLDTRDGLHIRQFGFAKKTGACEIESVVKPLLFITPPEFIELVIEVRGLLTELGAATDFMDNQLETLAKHLFPQFLAGGHPCGTHVCRALYANIAHRLHARPDEGLTSFTADVLGHEGLPSVPNYLHVRVVFPEDPEDAHEEARVQLDNSPDVLRPLAIADVTGKVHEFLPAPRRRLSPEDRERLYDNYANRLALAGIFPSRAVRSALNLIST